MPHREGKLRSDAREAPGLFKRESIGGALSRGDSQHAGEVVNHER
jgi:hypothetical protein